MISSASLCVMLPSRTCFSQNGLTAARSASSVSYGPNVYSLPLSNLMYSPFSSVDVLMSAGGVAHYQLIVSSTDLEYMMPFLMSDRVSSYMAMVLSISSCVQVNF